MNRCLFLSLFLLALAAVAISGPVEDAALPGKHQNLLAKLNAFEAEQLAAAQKAIEKKRAEVAAALRTDMVAFARDGNVEAAVAIRQAILDLGMNDPLKSVAEHGTKKNGNAGGIPAVLHESDFEKISETCQGNPHYTPSAREGVLELAVAGAGPDYETIGISIPTTDFSQNPVLRVRVRVSEDADLRIDLQDVDGNGTAALPVHERIRKSDAFDDFYFDFSRHIDQQAAADLTRIETLVLYVNPGAEAFNGTLHIDEIESSKRAR